jgi:4-amino-4-deoxy-L-arabinose transferase-like glycosyltransferase
MTKPVANQLNAGKTTEPPVLAQPQNAARDSLAIFLCGVFLFAISPMPEFVGFQARFALFAQEMLRHGPTFFPTTYHRPYPDYLATSTFLIYLASLPFGQVTPLAAILPTAVVSGLVLVVTYRIGAMRSRQWGLAAVLFSLLTVGFFSASRSIALDQYTSLAAAAAFYLVYSADCFGRQKRLWLLVPTWVFGFAFRGPHGLLLPAAVVCGYYLWNLRWRPFVIAAVSAGLTLGLCLTGLLAAAKVQGGEAFVRTVLDAQITGRMEGRGEPATYYWGRCFASYALAYPLAIAVVACRFKDILRRASEEDTLLGSLAIWTLVVLIAMSIPVAKKMRYVLPIVPALSLMASYLMVETSPKGMLLGIKRWFLRFCLSLPACVAVVVLALFLFAWRIEPSWEAHYFSTLATLVLLAVLAAGLRREGTGHPGSDLATTAVAVAACVALHIGIADPIYYSQERTRPFVSQVEALQEKNPGALVFFRVGPDAEGVKFMVNLSKPLVPRFLDSFDELRDLPGSPYVLMKEQMFRSMPAGEAKQMRSLGRGKIGHRDFVILTLEKSQDVQAGWECD